MPYTVGELAKQTGVTIRTLHHYDELGLVSPTGRSAAGYRLYDDGDVLRLQQVLFYRDLGFPLDEIAAVLDDPSFDRAAALRDQRAELASRRARVDGMIAAIDRALVSLERGAPLDDLPSLFDGFDPAVYADEALARWGQTPEFAESARRTKTYGKAEWEAIKRESDAIYRALAALMQAGAAPDDPRVRAAVEDHRDHITRWFYPCSRELHRGLGALYVNDPRFTANIDRIAPGLARYLCEAFAAA
ncbi:MAG: MerR family transcriptional regulator [Deltaproteobacteria bacterium]|nr:MerR family transcriptional regulator [Deltaproteobacteria bacterium]